MRTPAERARWCVNHGRVANEEWSRLRHGRIWRKVIEREGSYIDYLCNGRELVDYETDYYARAVELEIGKQSRLLAYARAKSSAEHAHRCFTKAIDAAVIAALTGEPEFWSPVCLDRREQTADGELYTHTRARLRWQRNKAHK